MSHETLLKGIIVSQKQTIEALERGSAQLRAALRVFTDDTNNEKEDKKLTDVESSQYDILGETDLEKLVESLSPSEIDAASSEAEESGQAEEKEELVPIWDDEERIYRCALCSWEIVERECQKPECGEEYSDYVCEESPDGTPLDECDRTFHLCDESYLLPSIRGTTPLLDVDPARLHPETVAYGFEDRVSEYEVLLTRGATRLMCETFNLSYSDETGIVLEMTDPDLEDIFDEWAGDAITSSGCESWKVFLGREVQLDDEDFDGSEYVNDFLEEALLFDRGSSVQWTTTEVSVGVWETKAGMQDDDDGTNEEDGDDGDEGGNDESESDSCDESDRDEENATVNEGKTLTSKIRVERDEYELDGIDDESVGNEYGVESDRDEDVFWGPDDGRYKYDSEEEASEEYETDPPETEEESGEEE